MCRLPELSCPEAGWIRRTAARFHRYCLKYEISPADAYSSAAEDNARPPFRIAERFVNSAQKFLQQITAYARAGINQSQNEQCFKHNAEMVPEAHELFHVRNFGEYVRHADSKRYGAARSVHQIFTDHMRQHRQILHLKSQRSKCLLCGVDSKIIGRMKLVAAINAIMEMNASVSIAP